MLPDLPAHGENVETSVRFATSEREAELPESVLLDAASRFGFSADHAALWGMSMGGAFANRAAARNPQRWNALIIVSSFDVLASVIDGQLAGARFGAAPLRRLIGEVASWRGGVDLQQARPVDWAGRIDIPVLVAHGDRDTLILIEAGRRLFAACRSADKTFVEVPEGTHERVLVTKMPLYATMVGWLLERTAPRTELPAKSEPSASK